MQSQPSGFGIGPLVIPLVEGAFSIFGKLFGGGGPSNAELTSQFAAQESQALANQQILDQQHEQGVLIALLIGVAIIFLARSK